jgi:hypothetical protein
MKVVTSKNDVKKDLKERTFEIVALIDCITRHSPSIRVLQLNS